MKIVKFGRKCKTCDRRQDLDVCTDCQLKELEMLVDLILGVKN